MAPGSPGEGAGVDSNGIGRRLDNLELRLAEMQRELAELRGLAGAEPAPPFEAFAAAGAPFADVEPFTELEPPVAPVELPPLIPPEPPEPEYFVMKPPRQRAPAAEAPRLLRPPPRPDPLDELRRKLNDVDLAELLGARALALAGGIVTLLGIVFFFVLAVNRGWIGPDIRVLCGAVASALVFAAGVWLERRGESTHAALAAVGTGLAGGYATVLAAAALYDLLPDWAALIAAAAIAGTAVVTALAWDSEIVAGLGLIGALLVPAAVAFQGGLSQVGTAFVALVLAGSVAVAVSRRWGRLLDVAVLVSLPQIAALALQAPHDERWTVIALAAVFWLIYLAAGIAWQETGQTDALDRRAAMLVSTTSIYSALIAGLVLHGSEQGIALLVVGAVDAAVAGATAVRRRLRELAPILAATALLVIAIGLSDLLSGSSLTVVWAADAALLAFLASRLRDSRLELGAVAYLALATVHTLVYEGRPDRLVVRTGGFDVGDRLAQPAHGVPLVLAVAAAFTIAAWFSGRELPAPRADEGVLAFAAPALAAFHRSRRWIAVGEAAAGSVLVLYAAALVILELFHRFSPGTELNAFEYGQVAIVALWSLTALALIAVGLRRSLTLQVGGLAWLAVTLIYVLAYCIPQLASGPRGCATLILAGVLLAVAVLEQLASGSRLGPIPVAALLFSVGLAAFGVVTLVSISSVGEEWQGAALLGLGAVYGAVAIPVFARGGQRDFSSLLGLASLGLGGVAASELTSDTYLVLAWSAAAAILALLSPTVSESRLSFAAAGFLALALGHTLVLEAPPSALFTSGSHPAAGVPALLFTIAAGVVLMLFLPPELEPGRYAGTVGLAVLGVYACSLIILGIAQHVGGGDTSAHFQRGQTAVSGFWGLIGLGLLYAGLRRGQRRLLLGGFALLGISLAKIFLYDLPNLSSVTRAASFLGVGALLLVAGYLYQRLSAADHRGDGVGNRA